MSEQAHPKKEHNLQNYHNMDKQHLQFTADESTWAFEPSLETSSERSQSVPHETAFPETYPLVHTARAGHFSPAEGDSEKLEINKSTARFSSQMSLFAVHCIEN